MPVCSLGAYTKKYSVCQINLPHGITGCAQTHKETSRFAAGAVLMTDFSGREYNCNPVLG